LKAKQHDADDAAATTAAATARVTDGNELLREKLAAPDV
jgi:hypothetical protein